MKDEASSQKNLQSASLRLQRFLPHGHPLLLRKRPTTFLLGAALQFRNLSPARLLAVCLARARWWPGRESSRLLVFGRRSTTTHAVFSPRSSPRPTAVTCVVTWERSCVHIT